MLAKLAEMDQLKAEVEESILLRATGYAGNDSKGYRNAAKKLIKELEYATKARKDNKTLWTLTESGREYCFEHGVIEVPQEPKTNEEHHAQYLEILEKTVNAPQIKLHAIFDLLKDGEWHTVSELLTVSEYKATDSKGYRCIMKGMKELELLEKKGKKIRFNDKAFKFGRP